MTICSTHGRNNQSCAQSVHSPVGLRPPRLPTARTVAATATLCSSWWQSLQSNSRLDPRLCLYRWSADDEWPFARARLEILAHRERIGSSVGARPLKPQTTYPILETWWSSPAPCASAAKRPPSHTVPDLYCQWLVGGVLAIWRREVQYFCDGPDGAHSAPPRRCTLWLLIFRHTVL